jgi:hypothetical protein
VIGELGRGSRPFGRAEKRGAHALTGGLREVAGDPDRMEAVLEETLAVLPKEVAATLE